MLNKKLEPHLWKLLFQYVNFWENEKPKEEIFKEKFNH